ncbi:TetR/AcrR family transcriptional regulator [[Actinomadura] parvosata]|uniref:TetR/AcrR family transcriptional regulator n=1 Tax=[Actinomadura] parvosata TaxID=1955412 RepID=UPI00406CC68D
MSKSKAVRSAGEVKRERTRAALLGAARALFTERGWHRTRIEDVAAAAGVSTATAYNHFTSKQLLMAAVYRPLAGPLSTAVELALGNDSDPIDALLRHFQELAALARRRRRLTESLVAAIHEQTIKDRQVTAEPDETDVRHVVPLYTMLARLMEHGQRRGVLRSGPPVITEAAFYTDTLLHHALHLPEQSTHDTALNTLSQLLSRWAATPDISPHRAFLDGVPDHGDEEDLSRVLHRLMRQDADASRRALANDVVTRQYLEAGLRLSVGEHGADSPSCCVEVPSQNDIFKQVKQEGQAAGDEQAFRQRWPSRDDFVLDLLAYASWIRHRRLDSAGRAADLISNVVDPVRGAQEAASQELASILQNPATRLSLMATAVAHRFPELKTTTRSAGKAARQQWITIYQEMLAVNELDLRPGVTIDDLADILSVTVEGVAFLALSAAPQERERLRLTLHKAVLAVLASTVDPGDGLSLEEVLWRRMAVPTVMRGIPSP